LGYFLKEIKLYTCSFFPIKNSPAPELWTRCPQLWLPALISHPWLIGTGFMRPSLDSQIDWVQ
jgi:hypothetical protein